MHGARPIAAPSSGLEEGEGGYAPPRSLRGASPGIGRAPQLKEAAFRLRAERPCLTDPLEVNDQGIMACLESRTVQRDERVKEGLRDRLHRSLRLAWMERLRRRARVRVAEQLP